MSHNPFASLRQESSHYIIWVFITTGVKDEFFLRISFNIKCPSCEFLQWQDHSSWKGHVEVSSSTSCLNCGWSQGQSTLLWALSRQVLKIFTTAPLGHTASEKVSPYGSSGLAMFQLTPSSLVLLPEKFGSSSLITLGTGKLPWDSSSSPDRATPSPPASPSAPVPEKPLLSPDEFCQCLHQFVPQPASCTPAMTPRMLLGICSPEHSPGLWPGHFVRATSSPAVLRKGTGPSWLSACSSLKS